jgi:iron(III) transport system substrate-binding protein
MKKFWKVLFAGTLAAAMLTGCGGDSGSKDAGKVVIYSPNTENEVNAIIPAFEEKTGIKVELVQGKTGELVTRIDSEKGNPQADILWGGMNLGVYTTNPDLWEKYESPNEKLIDENYRNTTGYFTNYILSGSGCFILNNKLMKELGVEVKGYKDLLQPKLKGKIASGDPTSSSSAWAELTNMLLVMGDKAYDDKAWDYVKEFVKQLNGVELSSSSAIYKGVAEGEYAVGVSYEDPCVSLLQDGADVTVVYPQEGAVWLPASAAIIKNAPNMEQAKAFIDYLISDEAQEIISGLTVRGTNTSIKSTNKYMKPMSEINVAYEDIKYCADHKAEWQAKYADIKRDAK